jgi:hypothetical protein
MEPLNGFVTNYCVAGIIQQEHLCGQTVLPMFLSTGIYVSNDHLCKVIW